MKILPKGVILLLIIVLTIQTLTAKMTTCYKKNWASPSTIETTKLDGGVCRGHFSYKQMVSKGWFLEDIQTKQGKHKSLSYYYVLTKGKSVGFNNATFIHNKYPSLEYTPIVTKLTNISNNIATINIGNLRVGQSGIVQHIYKSGKSLIVANALVISSVKNSSKVKLVPFLDIKQNAMPTSRVKVVNGDKLILNYMYSSSMIIAPSQDAFIATKEKFKNNNFLHPDLFGAKLKFKGKPLPSKEIIQDFAIKQNLGTIFFIIASKVYIVDAKTFAILDTDDISYNFTENNKMPFYTRVQKIEKKLLNYILDYKDWLSYIASFLGNDNRTEEQKLLEGYLKETGLKIKSETYDNYYETLLGLK